MDGTSLVDSAINLMGAWYDSWLTWDVAKAFANSAFTTSLVGALAGAFAGARAAQRIAERSKLRDEVTKELRSTNAAITLAFSFANQLLALKSQHVRRLKLVYDAEHARLKEHKARRATGQTQGNAPYVFSADFQSMSQTEIPVAALQDTVLTKLSLAGRPISLVLAITQGVAHLNGAIARRNELIERIKAGDLPQGSDSVTMYFGLPYADGHVNNEYGDAISGIASYTDDSIFAAQLLCRDLQEHGTRLLKRYSRILDKRPQRVTEVSFDKARADGLIPPDDDYKSWFTSFVTREEEPRRWWRR